MLCLWFIQTIIMSLKFIRLFFAVLASVFCLAGTCAAHSKALDDAIAAFNKGRYMESLGLFNQAKISDSDNPLLHYYMASALMKLNQKPDAIREYKMALLLQPKGKVAEYCEAALKSLEPSPLPAKKTMASAAAPKAIPGAKERVELPPVSQQPQVISILCGCSLCHRADLMLTDLHTKYGDQIVFIRTMKNSADQKTRDIIEKYQPRQDPTVILINNNGTPAGTYVQLIAEADLHKAVDDLAKTSPRRRMASPDDKKLSELRDGLVAEVESRISHDQLRVDFEIKQIEHEKNLDIAALTVRGSEREIQAEQIKNEAERKIKFINDDFEKRKKEYYKAVQDKIKGLESTASYGKPSK